MLGGDAQGRSEEERDAAKKIAKLTRMKSMQAVGVVNKSMKRQAFGGMIAQHRDVVNNGVHAGHHKGKETVKKTSSHPPIKSHLSNSVTKPASSRLLLGFHADESKLPNAPRNFPVSKTSSA